MKDDRYLLDSKDILGEMRKRITEIKNNVMNNPNSTQRERKLANDVYEFIIVEDCFNNASQSTVFAIFEYLGYSSPEYEMSFYYKLYKKVLKEVNMKYKLIDENQIMR